MRWKVPQPGDTRTRRRFAWWPVTIGEERVWLEWYWEEQEFGADAEEFLRRAEAEAREADRVARKGYEALERECRKAASDLADKAEAALCWKTTRRRTSPIRAQLVDNKEYASRKLAEENP